MEDIAYKALAEFEKNHWWFVSRRSILHSVLEQLASTKDLKILEIGAGTGGNIEMLKKFGKVTALEGNPLAITHLKQKEGIQLLESFLDESLIDRGEKYDLIVLFDVLEHIEDDDQAMHIIKTLLTPTGSILLTVPAFKFLWSDHDKVHHHHRRYNKKELLDLAKKHHLSVKRATYFNTILFPMITFARIILNLLPLKEVDQTKKPNKIINMILTKIFSSEKVFLKHINFPIGVSLLLHFEKEK